MIVQKQQTHRQTLVDGGPESISSFPVALPSSLCERCLWLALSMKAFLSKRRQLLDSFGSKLLDIMISGLAICTKMEDKIPFCFHIMLRTFVWNICSMDGCTITKMFNECITVDFN